MHPNEENLLLLKNDAVEVGLLPQYGGHVVLLRAPGGDNMLKSDPHLWIPQSKGRCDFTSAYHFKPVNGHVVWLGPQDEWWVHQDADIEKKEKRAPWPPDPFLTAAAYNISSRGDCSVTMLSTPSPFTGMQLSKTVTVHRDGRVSFTVTGTNTRHTPVSWDLWLNTRMNAFDRCYVPVDGNGAVRLQSPSRHGAEAMASMVADGMFTFQPEAPSAGKRIRTTKAFIHPAQGWIAGFKDNRCLYISFPRHERSQIHERQAQVEIFNCTTPDGSDDLLELEYHAPYKILAPGESMSAEQSWMLHPYAGDGQPESHISFLRNLQAGHGNAERSVTNPAAETA